MAQLWYKVPLCFCRCSPSLCCLYLHPSLSFLFLFFSIPASLFIPPFSLPSSVYPLCQSGFILWVLDWCSNVLSPPGQSLHVVNRLLECSSPGLLSAHPAFILRFTPERFSSSADNLRELRDKTVVSLLYQPERSSSDTPVDQITGERVAESSH